MFPCGVSFRVRLGYLTVVILWMAIIYAGSSDRHSFEHSSRIFGPFLKWIFPQLTERELEEVIFGVRKIGHLTEYAILAILLWLAIKPQVENRLSAGQRFGISFSVVFLYAIADELHQTFVPTRRGSGIDVLFDSIGGLCGLAFVWSISQLRVRKNTGVKVRDRLSSGHD